MKSVCVFCASGMGNDPKLPDMAFRTGQYLARRGIEVIYGGAAIGLMGRLADGVLSENGRIIGVIPEFLKAKEIVHHELTELITVETMLERKVVMMERSEGFITLPGGFGTMDELYEVLTMAQLGFNKNPIGVLNFDGYYDGFFILLKEMISKGLLRADHEQLLIRSNHIESLVEKMEKYKAPELPLLDSKLKNGK